MLSSKNLHYIYNIEYYDGVDFLNTKGLSFDDRNKELLNMCVASVPELPVSAYTHSVTLKTTYPGLLTGIGMLHEIGAKNGLSLGMNFDYVTGTLCIPGSTIKGIIKSAFDNEELIRDFLGKPDLDVARFSEFVFDGIYYTVDGEKKNVRSKMRDIFFDAYPEKSGKPYLDEDYFTPHGDNLTRNSITIKFLKVRPDTKLSFYFKLNDYDINGETCVSADEMFELFVRIIKLMGIGAKTNLGFGALAEENKPIKSAMLADLSAPQTNNYNNIRDDKGKNTLPWQTETKPCKGGCGKQLLLSDSDYCSECHEMRKK